MLGVIAGITVFSATQIPTSEVIGARSLALSPDASQLAFSYRGDIWVVPSSGGRAMPVTSHVEMDDNPVWSPDGESIAFTSNRSGSNDIFVVNLNGGATKRLTWNSASDVPGDWSPDGKWILMRSTRDRSVNGLFELNVSSGAIRPVLYDFMTVGNPKYSPNGQSVLYTRFGFPWTRPRYHGSAASQMWIYDRATNRRTKLRDNGRQHLWPNWTKGGISTVTFTETMANSGKLGKPLPVQSFSAPKTPNAYRIDLGGKERAITKFAEEGVRFLTEAANGSALAFERDGTVYVQSGDTQAKPIVIKAISDDKGMMEESLVLTGDASSIDLSPDGKTLAFSVRGEVWTVPVSKGKGPNKDDAMQLTTWEGSDDAPIWTPDGKAIFFVSDREGAERLYRMDVATQKASPITNLDADVERLELTPDKSRLSFWLAGKSGGLYTVPVAGGTPTLVLSAPKSNSQDYSWSPDGRWVAYTDSLPNSGQYYWEFGTNIRILDTTTGKSVDVTQINVSNSAPAFSADGKFLYFVSSRQGGGLFILPLQKDEIEPNLLQLEYKKPTEPVKVEIDFDQIDLRARKFVNEQIFGVVVDPETGNLYANAGGDLMRIPYNGENPGRITQGGGLGPMGLTTDGKNIQYIRNGALHLLELRKNGTPQTRVDFRAAWTRDVLKERVAAFNEFYRAYNRSFYDPAFHGRNWTAINQKYRKFIPSIAHRNEMATVLNMIIGEVEASHTEVGAAPGNPGGPATASLGFYIDYGWTGNGIKVLEVPDRSPASFAKSKLLPGDVVLKINGKDVAPNESLYRDVLNGQTNRELTLSVHGTDDKPREVKYRAPSTGEFGGIVFANWLEHRRQYVDSKSGGKLAYAHIAGMNGAELERFNQILWQRMQGRSGAIIDVRGNGGGNTSDMIIDVLERRQNAFYVPRDDQPVGGPGQVLGVPTVVMCAQNSFSNAEMFPNAMRTRGLAKLVGMPTPGYVIYTGGFRLIDGTNCRMPFTGVYRIDGSNMENDGVIPDYVVEMSPEDFFAGRDPQLDKAIEVLMKQVK